jgi:hypothetical protein
MNRGVIMRHERESISLVIAVWRKVVMLSERYPVIGVPFLLIGIVDGFLLFLLLGAGQPPLSALSYPVISTFWGKQYLQYPLNLFLLPKVFSFLRDVSGLFIGVLLTTVSVAMLQQAYRGGSPTWEWGRKKVVRQYARCGAVWAVSIGSTVIAMRLTGFLQPAANSHLASGVLGFMASGVIQIVLFFALPAVVIENRKIGASLQRSFSLVGTYPSTIAALVLVPNAALVPLLYAYTSVKELVERSSPEIIVYILGARIILLLLVNYLVISSATVLLLMHRESEKAALT